MTRETHAVDRSDRVYDVAITGGRVIDPETGLDDIRNVGIETGKITVVTRAAIAGTKVIDATGLVVAPGFIDLHSHAQGIAENRLQALDGVTTALELESGLTPVATAYARMADEGRPINFGYSASWAAIRMHVLAESPLRARLSDTFDGMAVDAWRGEATPRQMSSILGLLEAEIEAGALGIGILLGYAPETSLQEYVDVAALAAHGQVPTFTHARPLVEQEPEVLMDGADEIAAVAARTGAHMHLCHMNSTSNQYFDRVSQTISRAQAEGSRITSEGYPYGAGMTTIGSAVLSPDRLHVVGVRSTDIVYARTNERMSGAERLRAVREEDPAGLAFVHFYDEETSRERLLQAIGFPGGAVASDAVPITPVHGELDPTRWPIVAPGTAHPRLAGTFGRTLRIGVRETGAFSLIEAIAKCSLYPARVLESASVAGKRKGRIQVGCDADITIFDPAAVSDRATYERTIIPSVGFVHVLVGGVPVVSSGEVQLDVMPGRAVRGQSW